MATLTVRGNLVEDSESKTSKSGRTYQVFKIIENLVGIENKTSSIYSVTVMKTLPEEIAGKLKKGAYFEVSGSYNFQFYRTKYGVWQSVTEITVFDNWGYLEVKAEHPIEASENNPVEEQTGAPF